MTREDKELLLKDLCTRLPHHPRIKIYNDSWEGCQEGEFDSNLYFHHVEAFLCDRIEILPYLRPMSSMTEEERLELSRLTNEKFKFYLYTRKPEIICYEKYSYLEGLKVLDWLNAHHFDYRDLIPMGLALEAPEGMYKIK